MSANAQGVIVVKLAPDHWIQQPRGYVMVGLTAKMNNEQQVLAGLIDHPSCSTVIVKRVVLEAE